VKLPEFNRNEFLNPGIYKLTWTEVCEYLGWNYKRKSLLQGLREGLEALKECGCKKVYLDGSFVSKRDRPKDFDVCFEEDGVDFDKLKANFEALTIFTNGRQQQKRIYKGEFVPASTEVSGSLTFKDLFQLIKDPVDSSYINTHSQKGIISINLDSL